MMFASMSRDGLFICSPVLRKDLKEKRKPKTNRRVAGRKRKSK